jgi:hypothetical protein
MALMNAPAIAKPTDFKPTVRNSNIGYLHDLLWLDSVHALLLLGQKFRLF